MKALRALLTILAVAAAAFLAFRGCRGAAPQKPSEAGPVPTPDDDGSGKSLIGELGGAKAGYPTTGPTTEPPAPPPAASDVDATLAGTPAKPDAEPSLVVPYRAGTKCRYRVTESELQKDRDSGEAAWFLYVWTVSTEVVQGDGSGAARVRFQIDSFEYHTQAPDRRIVVDSRHPDRKVLDDYKLGRVLLPRIATCGMPVEFAVDAAGAVRAVEGVNALNRKFLDVVGTFGAQQERDAVDAPTAENMIEKWGACLFPALGGSKLKTGATRDTSFSRVFLDRWAVVASGKLRVTHDDADAFRVEFVGTPKVEELNRPALHGAAVNVEKSMIYTDANSYVASWRIDRAKGRLLASRMRAKYCLVVGFRAGLDENHQQQYVHPYTDTERRVDVEILDQ